MRKCRLVGRGIYEGMTAQRCNPAVGEARVGEDHDWHRRREIACPKELANPAIIQPGLQRANLLSEAAETAIF
jgi:hypothetical protein